MELKEYFSVVCATNKVRQRMKTEERLTLEELGMLCRMCIQKDPIRTSDMAIYQDVLRPTMTHRSAHLEKMGYITRSENPYDKRSIVCQITPNGRSAAKNMCASILKAIPAKAPYKTSSLDRMMKVVDALCTVFCMTQDQVLLTYLLVDEKSQGVSDILLHIGSFQPTITLAVEALSKRGYLKKEKVADDERKTSVIITDKGMKRAQELADKIGEIVVRRPR